MVLSSINSFFNLLMDFFFCLLRSLKVRSWISVRSSISSVVFSFLEIFFSESVVFFCFISCFFTFFFFLSVLSGFSSTFTFFSVFACVLSRLLSSVFISGSAFSLPDFKVSWSSDSCDFSFSVIPFHFPSLISLRSFLKLLFSFLTASS